MHIYGIVLQWPNFFELFKACLPPNMGQDAFCWPFTANFLII
jgi:hypothetical protein